MAGALWLLEHSEETGADPRFAWALMTEVSNWSDPPARLGTDGPFREGARGRTVLPGHDPVEWRIGAVREGESYTIESELDGAVLLCEWSFRESPQGGTQLVQRLGIAGDNADRHADGIRAAFEPSLAAGMRRIATQLTDAAAGPARRPGGADDEPETSNGSPGR